jgi:hypothetical protein
MKSKEKRGRLSSSRRIYYNVIIFFSAKVRSSLETKKPFFERKGVKV